MIGGGPTVLVERALDQLGVAAKPGDVERLTTSFKHTYLEQGSALTTLFPGAFNCLEHLKSHDVSIGLCSNKPEQSCTQLLADLEIEHFFSAIQGSGSGLPMKPHPAALFAVLQRLDTEPAKSLYVGDSKTDVDTARAASVPVALVNGGYTVEPATTLGADWVVESLADIPSIWLGADS
jgi:phosphoglycolate phosphatase